MIKQRDIHSILSLTLPLMAAFFAQKCMQLIDTVMMGWLGPYALAAGALGSSLFFITIVFCLGTLSAVGVFIARAKGAKDLEDIRSSLQHGLFIAVLLSLPCMIIVWFAPHLLTLLGENEKVVANVVLLIHGLVWGIPGYLLFTTMREFISAFSLTRVVLVVALSSIPLTFLTNYILIYGKLGFPAFGIAGIGYASAGVMWFMFFCLLFYSKQHKTLKSYIAFNLSTINSQKVRDMLYIGIPSGALFVLESSMFVYAAMMMGFFGVENLAAFQIAMQCASIAYSLPFALSVGTALLVGHAMGAQDVAEANRSIILCFMIALIFSASIAILFLLAPDFLIGMFYNESENNYKIIHQVATTFLAIAALFQCFDAVQAIANGALRGMRDTFIPMLICVGCYWVIGICSIYLLSFHTRLGATGIWYGLTLGILSTGFILLLRLLKKINSKPVVLAKHQPLQV